MRSYNHSSLMIHILTKMITMDMNYINKSSWIIVSDVMIYLLGVVWNLYPCASKYWHTLSILNLWTDISFLPSYIIILDSPQTMVFVNLLNIQSIAQILRPILIAFFFVDDIFASWYLSHKLTHFFECYFTLPSTFLRSVYLFSI